MLLFKSGMTVSYKTSRSLFVVNVWRVRFIFHSEEWEQLVVGVSSCSGNQAKMDAVMAVAQSYGGQKIKVLSVEFLKSGLIVGSLDEGLRAKFGNTPEEMQSSSN